MLKEIILKFFKLENLVNNVSGFVETRMELLKYEIKEDLAKSVSKILLLILIAFVIIMFIVFISLAIAFEISDNMGRLAGFSLIGCIYLLIAFILLAGRKGIASKLEKIIFESIKKK